MNIGLIIALSAGLLSMLGWGISDFFAKKSVDRISHTVALFWMQALGIIPLLLLFLFQMNISGITLVVILKVIILGVVDVLGYLFFYKALQKGKASIVSPIVASYSALSVIIATVFLGEKLSVSTILILLIIFIGIIITSIDFDELKRKGIGKEDLTKGIPEAILGAALFSIWFPFWDNFVSGQNWLLLVILLRIFMSLFLLTQLKITKRPIIVKDKSVFGWLIIIGLLDAGAYAALTWGYGVTSYISIITVLSATYSVPTLILAGIFLKERLKKFQYIGIFLILLGIVALALF